MSDVDLASMLADALASGVYDVEASGRARIVAAARALAFEVFALDLSGCRDQAAVLARLTAALDLPAWFGGNWDALADCLNDLSWRPAEGYVLLLEHAEEWQAHDAAGFDTLIDIAQEASTAWAMHEVPFWLLVLVPQDPEAVED